MDVVDIVVFNKDVNEFVKRRNTLTDNVQKLHLIVWGQCSKPMRVQLIRLKEFKSIDDKKDTVSLLMEVKAVSYEYKGHRNLYLTLDNAKTTLCAYSQKLYDTNTTHYNTFQALVEVVEHHSGSLCRDCALMLLETKNKKR